jgi:hypothetical protein
MFRITPFITRSCLASLLTFFISNAAFAQHGWGTPVTVDEPDQSGLPVVAPGRVTPGVWACVYVNGSDVEVRITTDNGATWSNATTLQSGSVTISPAIASDSTGVMIACWHFSLSLNYSISTDEGLTWSTPVSIPGGLGLADYSPSIATNGSGTYVIVHEVHNGSSDYDIAFTRSTDYGANWSSDAYMNSSMFSDGAYTDNGVSVAFCSTDKWVTIFSSDNTLGGTVTPSGRVHAMYCLSSNNGASWTNMAPLTTYPQVAAGWPSYWPSIASDGEGNVVATLNFHNLAGGVDYDVYAFTSSDSGNTWSAPISVGLDETTDSHDERYPFVGTDKAGHWVCTYSSDDSLSDTIGSDYDVLYSESRDNGHTWTPCKAISGIMRSDTASDQTYRSGMAVDPQNNWMVVYGRVEGAGSDDVLCATSAPDLAATSSTLSFGDLDIDAPPASTVVTYANEGLSTLTISSISVTGTDATQFSINPTPDLSPMLPNTSRTLTIQFDPNTLGNKAATVSFATNDEDQPVLNGDLSGTGIDQEIEITAGATTFAARNTEAGPSQPSTFIITNTGTATLNISSISLTGTNASDFVIDPAPSLPIALSPGNSTMVNVAFDPMTAGAKTANLMIVSDDTDEGTVNFTLTSYASSGFTAARDWNIYY